MSKGVRRFLCLLLGVGMLIWVAIFIGQRMTPDAFMTANLAVSAWNISWGTVFLFLPERWQGWFMEGVI